MTRGAPPVRLRPLRADDEDAMRAAQRVMAGDGYDFAFGLRPDTSWPSYLRRVADTEAGVDLPPGRVPATFRVAEVDGVLAGRVSIRHRLNEGLLAWGGHIGYGVLPAFRRRGVATEILRQSLPIARRLGVDRVLLTCTDDNLGSIRVIERCGGRLDEHQPVTPGDPPKLRYWID